MSRRAGRGGRDAALAAAKTNGGDAPAKSGAAEIAELIGGAEAKAELGAEPAAAGGLPSEGLLGLLLLPLRLLLALFSALFSGLWAPAGAGAAGSARKLARLRNERNDCLRQAAAHVERDEFARALGYLNHAIQKGGGAPPRAALVLRGLVLAKMGKVVGALEDLNLALELAPGDPEVLVQRAQVHFRAKNNALAIADFTQAVQALAELDGAPKAKRAHASALQQRGEVKLETGDKEAAVLDLRACLEIDPTNGEATSRLESLGAFG